MLPQSRLKDEFFPMLTKIDVELARAVAAKQCPPCGGPLHQANYQRKPRGGGLGEIAEADAVRHALCCGKRDCRRRVLPPSLRFLGRRVYLEAVVLLSCTYAQLAGEMRAAAREAGVPARTLRRWLAWWSNVAPGQRWWAELRPRMVPPPDETSLPRSLMERLAAFSGKEAIGEEVLMQAARCLAPATTSSAPDAASFVRAVFGQHTPT